MVSAWSIPTAKRQDPKTTSQQAPGPGAYTYDKNQKKTPPGWKIGTAMRQTYHPTSNPGPGTYNNNKSIVMEGSKYTIAQKLSPKLESSLFVPGPGAYNPRPQSAYQSQPKYTMGSKTGSEALLTNKQTPGPGSYGYKSTVENQPSMKFPKSTRDDLYTSPKTPGPGNYTKIDRPTSAGPKYGFGTSQRDHYSQKVSNPGPGNYQLKSSIDLSKGVTMISRRIPAEFREVSKVPGPGAYDPHKQEKKVPPAYRIGSSTRGEISRESARVPGPGAYEPRFFDRPNTPQIKIGTDVRKPLNGDVRTPGPGNYNLPNRVIEGPKYTMRQNNNYDPITKERQSVPGPGNYQGDSNLVKERPTSAKIGTSNRTDFLGSSKFAPGPGNYAIQYPTQDKGPKFSFGRDRRDKEQNIDVPGPGNYNLPSHFADVPKYLLNNSMKK